MTETLHITHGTDGRRRSVLRMERRLAHPPTKVWRALTDTDQLLHWFPFRVEVDLRVGGRVRFVEHEAGGEPAANGVVTDLDAPTTFAFTWGDDDHLRFDVRPDGDGTVLVFTHRFTDHYGAASFAAGWHTCFGALEASLAGRPAGEPGDMAAAHDRYVVALGLDEGSLEATADGWVVRCERQLTRHADEVWAVVTGGDDVTVGGAVPAGFLAEGLDDATVMAADGAATLDCEWRRDGVRQGRVRWQLGAGTGQGARLVVAQTGVGDAASDEAAAARAAWRTRLERLAAELRGDALPGDVALPGDAPATA